MSKRKKEQNMDLVYMAVSADEYELPYCTEDSVKELAKRVNKTAIEIARFIIEGTPELEHNVKYIAVVFNVKKNDIVFLNMCKSFYRRSILIG